MFFAMLQVLGGDAADQWISCAGHAVVLQMEREI
jgi:hypothetical protein